jgi:hypothetical protein
VCAVCTLMLSSCLQLWGGIPAARRWRWTPSSTRGLPNLRQQRALCSTRGALRWSRVRHIALPVSSVTNRPLILKNCSHFYNLFLFYSWERRNYITKKLIADLYLPCHQPVCYTNVTLRSRTLVALGIPYISGISLWRKLSDFVWY